MVHISVNSERRTQLVTLLRIGEGMGLNLIPKTGHSVRYFGAFHKACRKMLRLYSNQVPIPPFYTLYTTLSRL